MNFSPFPTIETERLTLRKVEESDCTEVFHFRSDEEINKFIYRPENRKTKTMDDALAFIIKCNKEIETHESITWGIALKGESKIIGSICLWSFSADLKTAEVGYGMDTPYHNKGIMTEALKAVLDIGFNSFNFKTIEAFTHKDNIGSTTMLLKQGFVANALRHDDGNSNNVIFELNSNG